MFVSVYWVRTTEDDRGSAGSTVGFFTDANAADRAARGKGYYGGDGRVSLVRMLGLNGHYYLLDDALPEGISGEQINVDLIEDAAGKKAAAVAKARAALTEDERKLLGLDI